MDKVPTNYITGKELERITGIPNLAVKAKELMYKPKAEKRQKNLFGDFYKKKLKAKYFDIGQGGKYGTLHYLRPTEEQIEIIKNYHLRKGAKYGLMDETIKGMKLFYNDPTFRKYIRKGEFIPDEILKARGIGANKAANITFRLAQHLNGNKFANVNIDLPINKSIAKKIFKKIEKAPFGNPYQVAAYKEAQNIITNELGSGYFDKTNMDLMKREARRILNKEGVPTFDPTKKGSSGFNINEIVGIRTAARVPGMAPYSQFINIMEGKLNTAQYANFVRQFEKFNNRMQTENKSDVIKDYNKYKKTFLKNNPKVKDSDLPKFSMQSPEKIYSKGRLDDLADQGVDLKKSYDEIGYTVDVGKKTRTLKEFITNPKNIARLKKFGKVGAITAGVASVPAIVAAKEEKPKDDIIYNPEIGAVVNKETDDKVSQATLLNWAADNPMPTAAVASAPLLSKTVRKGAGKLLKGLLSTLGSSAAGLTFAGATVKGNLEEGKNIVDATVDPMVGIELLYPEAAKRFGGKGLQNALGRALSLGRVGAMMTPVDIGITALGLGKMGIEALIDERERILNITPEELEIFRAEQEEQMGISA